MRARATRSTRDAPALPQRCPECEKELGRAGKGDARYSRLAIVLALLGATCLAGLSWGGPQLFPEIMDLPMALRRLFLGAPGLAIAALGLSLPKVVRYRCRRCGWSASYRLRRAGSR